jgi:hypothetical protein
VRAGLDQDLCVRVMDNKLRTEPWIYLGPAAGFRCSRRTAIELFGWAPRGIRSRPEVQEELR